MKLNGITLWLWIVLLKVLINGIKSCFYAEDRCPNGNISFWLYTNETQHTPLELDLLALPNRETLTPKVPLKVLMHGFTGSRDLPPNLEVRPVLLQTESVHVLSVDYAPLAKIPCYYPWTVYSARIVAKCLAQLLNNMTALGLYDPEDIHLIGFSLGAQIAGLTTNHLSFRVRRITGLDPAGPAFMTNELDERLDATDADFVDVIHTDPFFFSMLTPMGHVDFYPNFEIFYQPGCNYWVDGRPYNCNHFRAPVYYAESINSSNGFWAYNCGDWLQFLLQRCGDYARIPNSKMGYHVPLNSSGSYFLQTHAQPPFAKGPLLNLTFERDKIGDKQ